MQLDNPDSRYCVPPVTKLLAIRKVNPGYWPPCPEAGTGKPSYSEYDDCPAGSTPTVIHQDMGGDNGRTREVPACAKPVQVACSTLNRDHTRQVMRIRRDFNQMCETIQTFARPKRKDPYYFDIRNKDTGAVSRHYFNLKH